jgi:hypothetical protein
MPKGVFAMIQGNTNEVGATLVQHPDIKKRVWDQWRQALFDLANAETEPILYLQEVTIRFILPHI